MNVRQWLFSVVALTLVTPGVIWAAGLVPCGGRGEGSCQACHLLDLVNSVAGWLVGVLGMLAAIMFVIAGFRLVTAAGNPSVMQSAKDMIMNVAIGFTIVLSAWLLIDFMMKSLLLDGVYGAGSTRIGPWNTVQCVEQPESKTVPAFVGFPTPGASRGTAYNSGTAFDPTIMIGVANLPADEADTAVSSAAAQYGLGPTQVRNMQALMRVESGGCRNKVSPVGAIGCMQIMPNTAKQYDESLQNLTTAQSRERLMDDTYNTQLGVKIYADLYEYFDGNETKVWAGYNGGKGAVDPSVNCSQGYRYQCEWDGDGCLDGVGQNCTRNTGYQETRNYVQKIAAVAAALP